MLGSVKHGKQLVSRAKKSRVCPGSQVLSGTRKRPPVAESTSSSASSENYEDGVVAQTRARRLSTWKALEHLVVQDDVSGSWSRLLEAQTKYAQTHGRRRGPMKESSRISLLGKTIGMVGKYAPWMGRAPKPWLGEIARLAAIARRDRHMGHRATAATWVTVLEIILALEGKGRRWAALFLHLLWLFAARGTSIAQIQGANVRINHLPSEDPEWETLSVRFCEGKTIRSTGTYTLHVQTPQQINQELLHLMVARRKYRYLFPTSTQNEVAAALNRAGLEIRSIRRGALQTMARAGAPGSTMLLMSRHTELKGLAAYLDDGMEARWEANLTFPWSKFLQTPT